MEHASPPVLHIATAVFFLLHNLAPWLTLTSDRGRGKELERPTREGAVFTFHRRGALVFTASHVLFLCRQMDERTETPPDDTFNPVNQS